MEANLSVVFEQVARDKGVDREILISALEESILVAAKHSFGNERTLNAEFNQEKGAVDLTQTITVVEKVVDIFNEIAISICLEQGIDVEVGDEMVFPIYYLESDAEDAQTQDKEYGKILNLKTYRRDFGRIAAQTAKQVIVQRIADAERNQVFHEYKDRTGELITGIIRRFEYGNIIVDLGRTESILPVREQCHRESYRVGDRIQAYVSNVQENTRGPQIILSRISPELLIKLFETEVPEITEGIVLIKNAVRDPGIRSKIAVYSTEKDVDPVGACVGMKGSRVQVIVQELRGEKIDIVPYSEDPATFVCNALQPAEVSRVLIYEGERSMEIVVPDDQLSLAIGRKGQNVRLASKLSGWKLDIYSDSQINKIKESAWESLGKVSQVNEFLIQTFYNHGIRSAQELLNTDRKHILEFPYVEEEFIDEILESAKEVVKQEKIELENNRKELEYIALCKKIAKDFEKLLSMDDTERIKQLKSVGNTTFEKLFKAGFLSIESIVNMDVDEFSEKVNIMKHKGKQVIYEAKQKLKSEESIRSTAEECGITVENGKICLPAHMIEEENITEAPSDKENLEEQDTQTKPIE